MEKRKFVPLAIAGVVGVGLVGGAYGLGLHRQVISYFDDPSKALTEEACGAAARKAVFDDSLDYNIRTAPDRNAPVVQGIDNPQSPDVVTSALRASDEGKEVYVAKVAGEWACAAAGAIFDANYMQNLRGKNNAQITQGTPVYFHQDALVKEQSFHSKHNTATNSRRNLPAGFSPRQGGRRA